MPQEIEDFLYRILNSEGQTAGTGFLVAEQIIVTCTHVAVFAASSNENIVGARIKVAHYQDQEHEEDAIVMEEGFSQENEFDLCFLRLERLPGKPFAVLGSAKDSLGHPFRTRGFLNNNEHATSDRGVEDSIVTLENATDRSGKLLHLKGETIVQGMSGAPVLDKIDDRIVGIITWGEDEKFTRIPYATPADLIVKKYPELKLMPRNVFKVAPPEQYVQRVKYEEVVDKLLNNSKKNSYLETYGVVLSGSGGYGKTTLARQVCQDSRIQSKYNDGIFMVEVGKEPKPEKLIEYGIYLLTGLNSKDKVLPDLVTVGNELRGAFRNKKVLIFIDDVWDASVIESFFHAVSGCAYLITTRDVDLILPIPLDKVEIDQMEPEEAEALLVQGINDVQAELLIDGMSTLAKNLHYWPILLELANATLRSKLNHYEPLQALALVDNSYRRQGIVAFDKTKKINKYQTATGVIRASIESLSPVEQERFLELAIFPEDSIIPFNAVKMLWSSTASLDEVEAQDYCGTYARYSLIQQYDWETHTFRLHSQIREYMVRQLRDSLPYIHQSLVEQYNALCTNGWASGPDDGYFFNGISYHLHGAGRTDELFALVLSPEWINARLTRKEVIGLIGDYDYLKSSRTAALIRLAFRLSAHILAAFPDQWPEQMIGRMKNFPEAEIQDFLVRAARIKQQAWLFPMATCFKEPGGSEVRTLSGHGDYVSAVAITRDKDYILSGSKDKTVKVWETKTENELSPFLAHQDWIRAVAVLQHPNWVITGSDDFNLNVWNLSSHKLIKTLTGHTGWIRSIAISRDRKFAVTGSNDKTIRIWKLDGDVRLVQTLMGHNSWVLSVAISPDGNQILSGYLDNKILLWSRETGECVQLGEHEDSVTAVTYIPGKAQVISASRDGTIKLWDLSSLTNITTLVHKEKTPVNSIALSGDGKILLSASDDKTVKVWNVEDLSEQQVLKGHVSEVNAVDVSTDGSLAVSASNDKTVKLWNLLTGIEIQSMQRHNSKVTTTVIDQTGTSVVSGDHEGGLIAWNISEGYRSTAFAFVIDAKTGNKFAHHNTIMAAGIISETGQIISASLDETQRVWDMESSALLSTHAVYLQGVTTIALSPKLNFALYGLEDGTIRVRSVHTNEDIITLGDNGADLEKDVLAISTTFDERLVISGGEDKTAKVWDLASGALISTFDRHQGSIRAVTTTRDGRYAISASSDCSVKVWDIRSGQEFVNFEGHMKGILSVTVTPDGQHVISGSEDETIRVWSIISGKEILRFKCEDKVRSCLISPNGQMIVAGDDSGAVYFLERKGW